MTDYLIYDTTSGQILMTFNLDDVNDPFTVPANVGSGQASLQALGDPTTQYVVSGAVVSKPALSTVAVWSATTLAANGTATVTLGSTLPNPTRIEVRANSAAIAAGVPPYQTVSVTTGTLTFKTTIPGVYTFTIDVFPYASISQDITAT